MQRVLSGEVLLAAVLDLVATHTVAFWCPLTVLLKSTSDHSGSSSMHGYEIPIRGWKLGSN